MTGIDPWDEQAQYSSALAQQRAMAGLQGLSSLAGGMTATQQLQRQYNYELSARAEAAAYRSACDRGMSRPCSSPKPPKPKTIRQELQEETDKWLDGVL